jgi:hypothetical protein
MYVETVLLARRISMRSTPYQSPEEEADPEEQPHRNRTVMEGNSTSVCSTTAGPPQEEVKLSEQSTSCLSKGGGDRSKRSTTSNMQQGKDDGTTNDARGRNEKKHQRANPTHQEPDLEMQFSNRPQIPTNLGQQRGTSSSRGSGRRRWAEGKELEGANLFYLAIP